MLICAVDNLVPASNNTTPPFSIIITITVLLFFFATFFCVFFCKCLMQNLGPAWQMRSRQRSNPVTGPAMPASSDARVGLDPVVINTFPTFKYSTVKDYRRERYGLECAICLCEFEDDNMLRLITECCHVFHQECVDLWLESHTSCPVCRRSLDMPVQSPEKPPAIMGVNLDERPADDSVSITIKDEIEGKKDKGSDKERAAATMAPPTPEEMERFSRNNSTGHSIIRAREDQDKYRLILLEHVQAKLLRGHNWTKSCTTFGEFKSKSNTGNGGFAEISGESDKL